MRRSYKGKDNPNWRGGKPRCEMCKKTLSVRGRIRCIAHKATEATRLKMSIAAKYKPKIDRRGEKHWNWKGGLKPTNEKIRHSIEYRLWREAVFARDNWTCQECGERGGELQADHIKSFAHYPELRFAIDNGRTLCIDCHKKTDNYAGKSNRKI